MRALSLLPFLAILFIGVGMPVIHPVWHDHAGIHSHLQHDPATVASIIGATATDECPICTFLATNHLQLAGRNPVAFASTLNSSNPSEQFLVSGQTCRSLPESRAPPEYAS